MEENTTFAATFEDLESTGGVNLDLVFLDVTDSEIRRLGPGDLHPATFLIFTEHCLGNHAANCWFFRLLLNLCCFATTARDFLPWAGRTAVTLGSDLELNKISFLDRDSVLGSGSFIHGDELIGTRHALEQLEGNAGLRL